MSEEIKVVEGTDSREPMSLIPHTCPNCGSRIDSITISDGILYRCQRCDWHKKADQQGVIK